MRTLATLSSAISRVLAPWFRPLARPSNPCALACALVCLCLLPGVALPARAAAATNPRFTGTPFFHAWSAADYHGSGQTWCLVQHPVTHFIYAGNGAGILEFDGISWRLTQLPGSDGVRALVIDRLGRVWASTGQTIWRLAPGESPDRWNLVSMMARLPAAERTTRGLMTALRAPDGVYFTNQDKFYFFPEDDTQPARVIAPDNGRMTRAWWMDGAPHSLTNDGQSILRVKEGRFERVAAGRAFRRPFSTRPARDGEPPGWFILTDRDLLHWPGGEAAPAPVGADTGGVSFSTPANHALALADGRFAFAMDRQGVLLYDAAGRLVERLDRSRGLPANDVSALAEDAEGGLWLAQQNRIVRIQLDSPFALHGPAQGLLGEPFALQRHRDRLYVGHSEGLSSRDAAGKFHPVDGLEQSVQRLVSTGDRLFAKTPRLYDVLPDHRARLLDSGNILDLLPLPHRPGLVASLSPDRLHLGQMRDDQWQPLGAVRGVSGISGRLALTPDRFLWAWSATVGLQRIDFRTGVRATPTVKVYAAAEGVPLPSNVFSSLKLLSVGDRLLLGTPDRRLRYDPASDRFVPDPAFSRRRIAELFPSSDGLLARHRGEPLRLDRFVPEGTDGWRQTPLGLPPLWDFNPRVVLEDPALDTLWLGGGSLLLSFDRSWRPVQPPPPLRVSVRRVETAAGRTLPVPATRPILLTAADHSLQVTFAAATFQPGLNGESRTMFRSRLVGLEAAWSAWSPQPTRDFTRLPAGDYTLLVQARALDGRESAAEPEDAFAFIVAPPWWLSRWGYALWAALGASGVAGIVALRTRVLRRRSARLEETVAARTRELATSNLELARLHKLELDEKISAQLAEEKTRLELLRYQLNPHFLFNTLNSLYGLVTEHPTASHMVLALSEFCRLTLTRGPDHVQTLGEELAMLEVYLRIEKIRWGDSLHTQITADAAARAQRLPSFLLLPLVENAIKHGGETSRSLLEVRLTACLTEAHTLEIEIANTGTWLNPGTARSPSTSIGLENLRERLRRHYPDTHEFTIGQREGWVVARLQFRPLVNQKT